MAKHVYLSDES